jgi:predicted dienelactone hydrolase
VAVFLQHPGSDDSVWRGKTPDQALSALQRAASLENFLLRVQDVTVTLNQLTTWEHNPQHPLGGRLDLAKMGMSGHSFGAVTTQAVSGQAFPGMGTRFTDTRIRAAVIFSPSTPRSGNPHNAFGEVKIPWMLMTGTKDLALIGHADLVSRRGVYPHLPPGDKYELVLFNAEHSAFTDRALPGDREPRNPNHHRLILALSTAFWDTYLQGNPNARAWLQGQGARSLLESQDQWQFK